MSLEDNEQEHWYEIKGSKGVFYLPILVLLFILYFYTVIFSQTFLSKQGTTTTTTTILTTTNAAATATRHLQGHKNMTDLWDVHFDSFTAQEMDKDVEAAEFGLKEKQIGEETGKENGHPAGDGPSSLASTVHSEHKRQERRKKAAMFLSRLKKGTKEEENPTQLVYGKSYIALVWSTRICHSMRCQVAYYRG